MPVSSRLLAAGLSDTGRVRHHNEDRIYIDADRGFFIVADGLGGHAAGERAAETAIQMIVARLQRQTGTTAERIREAITVANNEIHRLAGSNPDWQGMASVVTLAVVEDEVVHVGHVGDSRMYVLEPGRIRKLTRDHSPVGELEDSGTLSEAAAMAHPRRNEVFRDLGSEPHGPDDDNFIEVFHFSLKPDAALLICSDGLTDQVPAERIRALIEAHPRDPDAAVNALVQAANEAGGKDNVSVVLAEGPAYGPIRPPVPLPAPPRPSRIHPIVPFLFGLLLASIAFAVFRPYLIETANGLKLGYGTARMPLTLRVGSGAYATIGAALEKASPGDTVIVEPGIYRETVQLRSRVALMSEQRRGAVIEATEVGAVGDGVEGASFSGFRIMGQGDVGIRIVNSDLKVRDVEISGMAQAGIEVSGESPAEILASTITKNPGTGILVLGGARPVLAHNVIVDNGTAPGAARPGIQVVGSSAPVITGNFINGNGVEQIWVSPLFSIGSLLTDNVISPGVRNRTRQVKVITR
jgi:serine/threonine protein phosphatase PrpC